MRHTVIYALRDAGEGLRRSKGAAATAVALVFGAMLLLGTLLLARFGTADLMRYLESQITIKLFLDGSRQTEEIVRVLERQPYAASVKAETGEQLLERMQPFFQGRERLLATLKEDGVPDSITLELKRPELSAEAAAALEGMEGLKEVIYPQRYASALYKGAALMFRYGAAIAAFAAALAFLNVFLAVHLSMERRKREIEIKLLLGAHPALVRGQLLLEGGAIALAGSLGAAVALDAACRIVVQPLSLRIGNVVGIGGGELAVVLLIVCAAGTALGLAASYVSTRRMITHV